MLTSYIPTHSTLIKTKKATLFQHYELQITDFIFFTIDVFVLESHARYHAAFSCHVCLVHACRGLPWSFMFPMTITLLKSTSQESCTISSKVWLFFKEKVNHESSAQQTFCSGNSFQVPWYVGGRRDLKRYHFVSTIWCYHFVDVEIQVPISVGCVCVTMYTDTFICACICRG